MPVARHALLISDNPTTAPPRRVVTALDGTADVRLRPGNYTVESDQPVVVQGKAYYWRQTLVIPEGRDSALDLTAANAVDDPVPPGTTPADTPRATDTSILLRQWLDSVVELWTPTAHGTGFLVDTTGLIATNQRVVGDATSVEVQISRSIKVAGTVVEADRQRDIAVIHCAIELGVTYIDTADHNDGNNEELLAKALIGKRHQVVLASKFGNLRGQPWPWAKGKDVDGRAEYVQQACEASLRRLQTDYLEPQN